jgi:endonuclease G
LNRGYWADLEKYARDLTKSYKAVDVVTGPLYLPYTDSDGRRFVKYEVIGPSDVAVPTHFFKVITTEDLSGHRKTEAYILPNWKISKKIDFSTQFKVSVQKIEKAAGIVFPKTQE